ncbi:hypothetical protein GKAS_01289 [Kluyvera ascorbata ATCC 33433]|nr:hypothetical protein [Kluyvera ascorbata]KFD06793.1 hypothetical protein GKAS_01289 [Kluyvera ascorbata ATCC 33433]
MSSFDMVGRPWVAFFLSCSPALNVAPLILSAIVFIARFLRKQ